ncbi:DUF1523 family protein [Pseudodonghicola xiamenensis]|uniref:DUF1523 domain-containing protein n=1 Tax=Pseudodonghicola xiamenensis TaxID=337702 RepID=A0A8J3MCM1_9RHOB|nr:DUF1523 family protein [Pseudodonghicola xiamenensis]GHG85112.1 hypothetical protein GCM10010961_11940 [Pseudodonghicola xiamenensis]
MVYVKWAIILIFWTAVGAFLHYTLPQRDIARITDTYEKRIDPGENSWFWAQHDVGGDPNTTNRDVFFIQTRGANGKVMVYRNEDTAWSWPPYFKVNSSNLQAEAVDMKSTAENPKWVAIRHYGWRNEFLSIFPNAVRITPVAGPDVRLIPWFNIIILTVLAAIVYAIWVRWRRFRQRRIDPLLENLEDRVDIAGEAIAERRSRFRRWLDGRRG